MRANARGFKVTKEELDTILSLTPDIWKPYSNEVEYQFDLGNNTLSATRLQSGEYYIKVDYCSDGKWLVEKLNSVLANDPNNLKTMRMAKGMSQSALAEASGVSVRMIQHYEQGFRDVNKAEALTVLRLADALGCDVRDILTV